MLDPNQIYCARQELSLSQRELARRANVSRTALNQFEQGKYVPGANFCRKLRDYFETESVNLSAISDNTTDIVLSIPQEDLRTQSSDLESAEASSHGDELEADDDSWGWVMVATLGLSLILGRNIIR